MAEPLQAGECSTETACELLRCTDRHLRRLIADKWIKRNERGNLTTMGVVHGGFDWKDDQLKRSTAKAVGNRATDARAREIELRIAEKEKRVIGREEHLAVIQKGIGALRNEISGVPAALTRDRDLKHHCEDLLNGAFKRAADFLDEECRRLEVDSRSLSAKRGGRARSMGKGKSDIPRKQRPPRAPRAKPHPLPDSDREGGSVG